MASIARSLRPVAARLATRPRAAWTPTPSAVRTFSVTSAAQVKKYTESHEWIELSDDKKTGVIGITSYASHALGDVVFCELPTTPMEVEQGDAIGAVESVKSASDIHTPITCKVVSVNSELEETPALINKGPEDDGAGGGWFAKVEVGEAGVKDLENLMDAEAYKAFSEEA